MVAALSATLFLRHSGEMPVELELMPVVANALAGMCALATFAKLFDWLLEGQTVSGLGVIGFLWESTVFLLLIAKRYQVGGWLAFLFSAASCIGHMTGLISAACRCLGWWGGLSGNFAAAFAAAEAMIAVLLLLRVRV